jgi:hypothetical protein
MKALFLIRVEAFVDIVRARWREKKQYYKCGDGFGARSPNQRSIC